MGKKFKDNPKPEGDILINAARKLFAVDTQLDFKYLVLCTESDLPKGRGVSSMSFKVKDAWFGKDGNIIIYADPTAKVDNMMFDRYGNPVSDAEIAANRSTNKSMFLRKHGEK
jgi:hypothetical protein